MKSQRIGAPRLEDGTSATTPLDINRLSLVLLKSTTPLLITDASCRISWVNPAFSEVTGYTLDEAKGRSPGSLLQGPDTDFETIAFMRGAIERRSSFDIEVLNYRKDGIPYWAQVKADPVFGADGSFEFYVAFHSDITARKRAEEKVREQASLIDQADDAIIVSSLGGDILFWSAGAQRVYGWQSDEMLGRRLDDTLFPDSSVLQTAMTAVQERGSWAGELAQVAKDGSPLIVATRWSLRTDARGKPHSILTLSTNISARKSIEEQYFRAQRLESIGMLASGIVHDLNNILTPITVGAEELRYASKDDACIRIAEDIERAARNCAHTARQILAYGRGDDTARGSTLVQAVIKEAHHFLMHTFPKNIACSYALPPEQWFISAAPLQIYQVLINLCINAQHAMPSGGRLHLSLTNLTLDLAAVAGKQTFGDAPRADRYVCITVQDTGCGIPPELIERIFKPFFTTKPKGQGTGLGLAASVQIIKDHGGFISVDSEVGHGTSFKVFLPAPLEGNELPQLAEPTRDQDEQVGNGETILLIEDEYEILKMTRLMLENAGYEVVIAKDGATGVTQLLQHHDRVKLVVTDMMMPGLDGAETAVALRKVAPRLRIIGTSGIGDFTAAERFKANGVPHYIPKPYTRTTLLSVVRKILATDLVT